MRIIRIQFNFYFYAPGKESKIDLTGSLAGY